MWQQFSVYGHGFVRRFDPAKLGRALVPGLDQLLAEQRIGKDALYGVHDRFGPRRINEESGPPGDFGGRGAVGGDYREAG